jgi:RHS repeat-associated protein
MATGLHSVTSKMVRAAVAALLWSLAPGASAQTVRYIHTDSLGSVAVVTDQNRNVIERREYEPYGQQLTPAVQDGPGYTGHVQDAATGLTYMQQRYYDPQLGIFDSVDPVTAYEQPITNFCRYCYARNNPYKFTDPDGRNGIIVDTKKGNIGIAVPIKFVGPGATPANIAAIKGEVAKQGNFTVTNGGKTQNVAIRIVDVTPSTPKGAVNTITLTNGPTSNAAHQGASYVAGNRTSGEWNTQSPGMGQGEAMHETLHLVGGQDHYSDSVGANGQRVTTPDSGWSGNLSAQIPGAIDNRNMTEISAGANGAQNIRIKEK